MSNAYQIYAHLSNEDADEELRLLFGVQKMMDYPKPSRLIIK